jgi:hypothetical protein
MRDRGMTRPPKGDYTTRVPTTAIIIPNDPALSLVNPNSSTFAEAIRQPPKHAPKSV